MQLTSEQAIEVYESRVWESWTDEQIVRFQLFQDCLAVPFDRFHQAIEKVLGRSVWTHEFANQKGLILEYLGEKPAPSFQEILDLIPEEKRLLIVAK